MKRLINQRNFLRINAITLGAVFVLILVGSIVRVVGAGMGCPDWPKCFGEYVPPTSAEGLPDNYQDIFREERLQKNERLARTFERLGYTELSERITKDPAVLVEQEFNATKAWVEYVNRLIGVVIGMLVFLNMILSFSLRKKSAWIPVMGIAIFVLTGFQGWVGSLVVSTNLLHGFITFHMLLALLIVALLIWMNFRAREVPRFKHSQLYLISVITILLFIPQLILGTEVRGVIDDLMVSNIGRNDWINELSTNFLIHRSYSWLILIGCALLAYYARKTKEIWVINTTIGLTTMVFLIMVAGIGMARFGFSHWLQPLHLILAVGIFSTLFYLTLRLKFNK
ncbi:COX15/CtaA family protein [Ekhidna sp.]|uniref:COX15/CtaA family protein n=1 Tax=Ekhidna sp. TaxID=2608089 RepID=UPI003BAAB703